MLCMSDGVYRQVGHVLEGLTDWNAGTQDQYEGGHAVLYAGGVGSFPIIFLFWLKVFQLECSVLDAV